MVASFASRALFLALSILPLFTSASTLPRLEKQVRAPKAKPSKASASLTFADPRAAAYHVDGANIPDVTWDAGDSYAGLMPISADPNETRKLYFWFWPAEIESQDLVFWTNGGPGCSALEGFLQENGPISWQPGTARPVQNPNSWTQVTNMLYVEQPVGTGFSQGNPDIKDTTDLAAEFQGFLLQFLDVFAEIKGMKFYATGESYAGYYVPYIAQYLYESQVVPLDLSGIMLFDPSLSTGNVQKNVVTVPFMNANSNLMYFNQSFINHMNQQHKKCGYEKYLSTYLTYPPPKAPFPAPQSGIGACDLWGNVALAASKANPAFSIYDISLRPPVAWDVLDNTPGSLQAPIGYSGKYVYFNRPDVQQAINAPTITWSDCASFSRPVYPDGNKSKPSTWTVLPEVIEKSQRSIIAHGLLDFCLLHDGTRLALQNMTWGGKNGFQSNINNAFQVPGQGRMGSFRTERGLTFVEIGLSGHQVPQYQPVAALTLLKYLLGQIPKIPTKPGN